MINKINGEWIADLVAMTCRNYTWGITVAFEKQGEAIIGKISEMPDNLIKRWLNTESGFKILEKIEKEAEEVFLMVYFENVLTQYNRPELYY
jgi:hypothetical protein